MSSSLVTTSALAAGLKARLRDYERDNGRVVSRHRLAAELNVSVRSLYAYLSGTTLIPDEVLSRLLLLLEVPGPEAGSLRRARDQAADARDRPLGTVVRDLPPGVPGFTGRVRELAELDRLRAARRKAAAPVVTVLAGTAGVGKTALALQWAHGARARFPDGCVFVDLRGYDPQEPLDPQDALGVLLRGLGLAEAEVPARLSARMSRYRTLADGRRMLIVLDNAFSAEQVRPLLPGASSCFVVITSRDDLAGLVARDGAYRIAVAPLPFGEGIALLTTLLGPRRVEAGQQAARLLVNVCAGLPLALRLAAEVASARSAEPLAVIAGEVREHRLAMLAASGDERADLRTVLSWSYRLLAADQAGAARAFRVLGLHPGNDFDAHSAAALLGVTPGQAARLIDILVRGHLAERRPGSPRRFRLHDLLRAYAAELAAAPAPAEDTAEPGTAEDTAEPDTAEPDTAEASLTRLFGYYALAAEKAAALLAPPEATDAGPARAWLDAERHNLVATVVYAADRQLYGYVSRLSAALHAYLDSTACYRDALIVHTCALRAPQPAARAAAQVNLAATCFRLGRLQETLAHAHEALVAAQACGDVQTQVQAQLRLGAGYARLGQNETAARHCELARVLARRTGDRLAESYVIGTMAIVQSQLGRYGESLCYGLEAVALARELGDRPGESHALCNVGTIYRLAGRYQEAVRYDRDAHAIAAGIGDRSAQATIAANLGAAHAHLGRHAEARAYFQQAIASAREIGHGDLEDEARAGLEAVARRLPPPGTAELCSPVQDGLA